MKKTLQIFLALGAFAASTAFAAPTITSMTATPNANGVTIDYVVSDCTRTNGASTITYVCTNLLLTATVGGVEIPARWLEGDISGDNGTHRIYWNMRYDRLVLNRNDVSINARLLYTEKVDDEDAAKNETYCVVDLTSGSFEYLTNPTTNFNADEYKTTKLVLKKVKSGSFVMGEDQTTVSNTVTLSDYYLGIFELTQKQWELVMGSNPLKSSYNSAYVGDAKPVFLISYNDIRGSNLGGGWPLHGSDVDATSFLGQLHGRVKGLDLDLPTEAQWEYACRAGTSTQYSFGDDPDNWSMWYKEDDSSTVHDVGTTRTKEPNDWGFYDMHGNASEWCLDWYAPSAGLRRVLRGGCWKYDAASCTSAFRTSALPASSDDGNGLRLSLNF